jgi:hypothetical protein
VSSTRKRTIRSVVLAVAFLPLLFSGGPAPAIDRAPSASVGTIHPSPAVQRPVRKGRPPVARAADSWALLIGINEYARTDDLVGSRPDVLSLRRVLLAHGWRDDHIKLITDRAATKPNIIAGIRWLARMSGPDSLTVFHYSGHERPTGADRIHREPLDIAMWTTEDQNISDGQLGRELGKVRAKKMWIDISACRAAGFNDPGMDKPGRLLTYSSKQGEFSFDAQDVKFSVFGYLVIEYAMRQKLADTNRDGAIAVQEAFRWAYPYVLEVTSSRQHPVMVDRTRGGFFLNVSR